MDINSANLQAIRAGFQAHFQKGRKKVEDHWKRVAMEVPSTAGEEIYGWLGEIPGIREWVGERVIHNLMEHDYTIKNKDFEDTISVNRNAIKDDKLGIYAVPFQALGEKVEAHPNVQVFNLLRHGWSERCYDDQNFFDTDHPVLDADGNETSVANTDGGTGQPWFLMATTGIILPLIYQNREPFNFVALDNPTDPNVFHNKKFLYGVDGRNNVGFGMWQTCWGSRQPLTPENYEIARTAITSMKSDYGEPMGLVPDLLVVPPALDGAARRLIKNEEIDGSTNEWKDSAEILMVPRLAA